MHDHHHPEQAADQFSEVCAMSIIRLHRTIREVRSAQDAGAPLAPVERRTQWVLCHRHAGGNGREQRRVRVELPATAPFAEWHPRTIKTGVLFQI